MKELISIIIPVYNGEDHIERLFNILLSQTYKNIEIIAVNDGSKDNSEKILNKLMNKDSRVKFINKETNTGVSDTKNIALDNCKGEYILFIDVDDIVSKDIVQILYENAKKYDADISSSKIEKVYDNDFEINRSEEEIRVYNSKEAIINALQGNDIDMFTTAKLYSKSLFENIRFPIDMKIIEDAYISCELILKSQKIAHTNQVLYKYIFRENSLMNSEFDYNNEINIVKAQLHNQRIILERFPDLKDLTEKRLAWAYIRIYDRMILSNNVDKKLKDKTKREILNRKNIILKGEFFTNKRKLSIIALSISEKIYKKLIFRRGRTLF